MLRICPAGMRMQLPLDALVHTGPSWQAGANYLMLFSAHAALQNVDLAQGLVSGSMRALDVAGAAGPIDTYFEGHIVDDVHNTFWTRTWGASREMDLRHWSKFEGFADIK
jgi:hypothetical protein